MVPKRYKGNEKYMIEYIGLGVHVKDSGSPERIGISGVVVDETRNTFIIEKKDGKEVTVPKKGAVFVFKKEGEPIQVEGSKIMYLPEERPKKIRME